MAKMKKYTLACRECGGKFESADPQARICKACIAKENARVVPKGPRPVDERIK